MTYTNNAKGHALWQFTGGNESALGLIGTEDLGGGLKANFDSENGFNVANGALGQGTDVPASAGRAEGANWGAVTLGRQYNSTQDILGSLQMSSASRSTRRTRSTTTTSTTRSAPTTRVKYVSPMIAGLQANLVYGFELDRLRERQQLERGRHVRERPAQRGAPRMRA